MQESRRCRICRKREAIPKHRIRGIFLPEQMAKLAFDNIYYQEEYPKLQKQLDEEKSKPKEAESKLADLRRRTGLPGRLKMLRFDLRWGVQLMVSQLLPTPAYDLSIPRLGQPPRRRIKCWNTKETRRLHNLTVSGLSDRRNMCISGATRPSTRKRRSHEQVASE